MEKITNEELAYMLTVLFQKIDKIERKAKGSTRMTPLQTYYDELRKLAHDEMRKSDLR